MARLLVTGGAGYVGSHVPRALRRTGIEVVVADDLRNGRAEFVDGPLERLDIGDGAALQHLFTERGPFDAVLHFAASIEVGASLASPLSFYRNNVAASLGLIESAVEHGTRAFVLSSTAAVYGAQGDSALSEDLPAQPENPYGASKAMVEQILRDAHAAHGLRWVALRYFNACGADPAGGIGEAHDPETHLIPLALEVAAGRLPHFSIYGSDYPTPDGTCVRDFIHVCDLADAHRLAVEGLLAEGPVGAFNLGTGRGHSVREVIAKIEHVTECPVTVVEASRRPGDPPVLVADPSRFREAFQFSPRRSDLDTIVRDSWAWHQSR